MTTHALSLAALDRLRDGVIPATPLRNAELTADVWWHMDADAGLTGTWHSPRGRLIELETQVTDTAGFLALHLRLPAFDLMGCRWFGFVARTSAARAIVTRACLRSGRADGQFHDQFFARHILSQPQVADHHDLLVPAHCPDLPGDAPWREVVLFLPPNLNIHWALQDFRLITL